MNKILGFDRAQTDCGLKQTKSIISSQIQNQQHQESNGNQDGFSLFQSPSVFQKIKEFQDTLSQSSNDQLQQQNQQLQQQQQNNFMSIQKRLFENNSIGTQSQQNLSNSNSTDSNNQNQPFSLQNSLKNQNTNNNSTSNKFSQQFNSLTNSSNSNNSSIHSDYNQLSSLTQKINYNNSNNNSYNNSISNNSSILSSHSNHNNSSQSSNNQYSNNNATQQQNNQPSSNSFLSKSGLKSNAFKKKNVKIDFSGFQKNKPQKEQQQSQIDGYKVKQQQQDNNFLEQDKENSPSKSSSIENPEINNLYKMNENINNKNVLDNNTSMVNFNNISSLTTLSSNPNLQAPTSSSNTLEDNLKPSKQQEEQPIVLQQLLSPIQQQQQPYQQQQYQHQQQYQQHVSQSAQPYQKYVYREKQQQQDYKKNLMDQFDQQQQQQFQQQKPYKQQQYQQKQYQHYNVKSPIENFKSMYYQKIQKLKIECQQTPDSKNLLQNKQQPSSSSYINKNQNNNNNSTNNNQTKNFKEFLAHFLNILDNVEFNHIWKVLLDVADKARKECQYQYAKLIYQLIIYLQPFCPEVWLEFSKTEEEYGNIEQSIDLLENSLQFCKGSEQLYIKLLKILDKQGDIVRVRQTMSKLVNFKIEKNWKIFLEGAQIEARHGKLQYSEKIIQAISNAQPYNGQVLYEKTKILDQIGDQTEAMHVCAYALEKNVKQSSIQQMFLKLYDGIFPQVDQQNIEKFIKLSQISLPRENIWKLYFEISQLCEKKGQQYLTKFYISKALFNAPDSMKWKCIAFIARLELQQGNFQNMPFIIQKMIENCQEKQRSCALIEASKCYEYMGQYQQCMSYLYELKDYMQSEWKIYMEYVAILMRNHSFQQAKSLLIEGLQHHSLAGRLWGELIQLEHLQCQNGNLDSAYRVFQIALNEIPKSGEVWCEGARICMNPLGNKFDLEKAEKYLNFAITFTPQYGDSFIELLKLHILQGQVKKMKQLKKKTINSQPNYGHLWFFMKQNLKDGPLEIWKNSKKLIKQELITDMNIYQRVLNNVQLNAQTKQNLIQRFQKVFRNNTNISQNTLQQYYVTGIKDYNNIFVQKQLAPQLKYKLIFQLDQSLNQQL